MAKLTEPIVQLVAKTGFIFPDASLDSVQNWHLDPNASDAENIIELSGRSCYQSWSNPAGRTNEEYILNILQQGHLSVLEHANVSLRMLRISRSCTHELVRHRHFSYSQLSQRYVNEADFEPVVPESIANDPEAMRVFEQAMEASRKAYEDLVEILDGRLSSVEGLEKTERRKIARQSARSVLPNAVETQIIVTGNLRAWRHFLKMRGSRHADTEIRFLAYKVWKILRETAPAVFGDFDERPVPGSSVPEVYSDLADEQE